MLKRYAIPLLLAGALYAQPPVAPTPEQAGAPRGDNVNTYNVTQSFETGYRWAVIGGNDGMYRSVVNYGNGIRLLGSNLTVNSREGHGQYFDEILLNTLGLGNDPYQHAILRVQKNGLYRYDLHWRLNNYYNPGLTVAAGNHFKNTARRLQDQDLTLLPQSRFRFRVGYSRNTEDGPALSTAQEFDANGFGFPVFQNVRRTWNEYRLGFDIEYRDFRFTLTRRWDFFKEDSGYSSAGVGGPVTSADPTVLQQFVRGYPVHGSNPGWLGNLFARRKLWGANARMTYVSGKRDFVMDEIASGLNQFGGAASRVILVSGQAQRPVLNGDLSLSAYPNERLTIINTTSVTSNRIDGNSTYSEFLTNLDLGTTVNFRYLGIRTVANATNVHYNARPWIGAYVSYRFSDRRVRTVNAFSIPAFPSSSQRDVFVVNNSLHAGLAGVRLRPWKPLTFNLEGEIGRADTPLTPVAEQKYHAINGRAEYRDRRLQLSTSYSQLYNINTNSPLSAYTAHSRNYTANASWSPRDGFSLDASYMKLHLNTQTGIAFFASTTNRPQLQTGFLSLYRSNIHSANLGAHFNVLKRADLFVGYSLTKDTGGDRSPAIGPIESLLASVQTFPLTYHSPQARVSIRISPKVRWNAGWQYYGYAEDVHLFGFNQNFRANTGYTSILWAF